MTNNSGQKGQSSGGQGGSQQSGGQGYTDEGMDSSSGGSNS